MFNTLIEFAHGMKHYQRERVVQRTLNITNSKKKIGRCLNCWTKSNVHVLSNNLETTYCPYPTSIRDSYAFPIFAPPPLYSLFASAPSLYPSITVIYCSKGYPCSDREMGPLTRPNEKFKLIQKFYIVKLPKIPPPPCSRALFRNFLLYGLSDFHIYKH